MSHVDDVRMQHQKAGENIRPLRDLAGVALLFKAAAMFPVGCLDRAKRVAHYLGRAAPWLGITPCDSAIDGLLNWLAGAAEHGAAIVADQPIVDGSVLITSRACCAVAGCGGKLDFPVCRRM